MYSPYIDRLVKWLNASGVPVELHADYLPDYVRGRCHNLYVDGKVLIEINEPSAREALLTLAHEAGHWVGASVFGYKKLVSTRERQAIVYGWCILELVGARHLFTRKDWIEFHTEELHVEFTTTERSA